MKTKLIQTVVGDELHSKVKRAAKKENRSVSNWVERYLEVILNLIDKKEMPSIVDRLAKKD